MTRLLISVLDERRDPHFDTYARGLPLISSSKGDEYVITVTIRSIRLRADMEYRLEPHRGDAGSNVLGPRNPEKERQNQDLFRPPKTDHGKMPNMKW
jgi:hypothetical protein